MHDLLLGTDDLISYLCNAVGKKMGIVTKQISNPGIIILWKFQGVVFLSCNYSEAHKRGDDD